jgi:quercetin dioxygenase-like cupin family protein
LLHRHPDNEQLGIVFRGKLDFKIGVDDSEKRVVLEAGDVYIAPRDVPHGESVFVGDEEYGECWILDVFAPPRPDLTDG